MIGNTSERGAAAVEFAVIVPALGLLIALMVGAARIWHAQLAVDQLASSSARAASLATSAADARARAQRIAREQSATSALTCSALQVDPDVTGFQVPVGHPAVVRVSVRCAVPLADLVVPGWPGAWNLQSEKSSVLDRYRRRG